VSRLFLNLAGTLVLVTGTAAALRGDPDEHAIRGHIERLTNRSSLIGSGQQRMAADTFMRLAVLDTGLARPEGARWDAAQRVWFISNINGGQQKDNNGYLSRVTADGRMEVARFVEGGQKGVTLHAPKGLAITGDTLWVTDLDAVRGFHRRTGAVVATVDLGPLGALFLNDLAAAPDGSLYVTDTGVRFDTAGTRTHTGPDRVFRIRGREPAVVLEGEFLNQPNGIIWDAAGRRFLIGPITGTALLAWPGPGARPAPVAEGPGRYDGIEILRDGRILISAWNDSTVSVVEGDRIRPVIRGVPAPADIGLDPETGTVAVPLILDGRVELWRIRKQ
jgi:sugar lactone lactonase YvrE